MSDAEVGLKPTRRWSYLLPDIGMSPSTHQNASSTLQNAPRTDQNTENDKHITGHISKHYGSFKSELSNQRRATPRWASSQHGAGLTCHQISECHRARIRTPRARIASQLLLNAHQRMCQNAAISFRSALGKQQRAMLRSASRQHGAGLTSDQQPECHRTRIRTPRARI